MNPAVDQPTRAAARSEGTGAVQPGLSAAARRLVLAAAFSGWLCAGLEMGLVPLASRPAIRDLLFAGHAELSPAEEALAGAWFARYLAAFLLGAACGGLVFGRLGDRAGRVRAMGLSILCYSVMTGLGWFVRDPDQLLVLRFLAGLGIGGMWPAGVALVAEAWPDTSRPLNAGLIGTAANVGILCMALAGAVVKVTPESWRWAHLVGGAPALLGVLVLLVVPESPRWLAVRSRAKPAGRWADALAVFRPPLLSRTVIGILLGAVPLLGTWGSGKWLLPWADATPGADAASTQALWAFGAALGSAGGGWLADRLGRRLTYFLVSLVTLGLNLWIYRCLTPTDAAFLPAVFLLGLIGTIFFGWLPLYLPELFPTGVRATGTGIAYNFGRFASAAGVLGAGALMAFYEGDYARVGQTTACVYGLGMLIILLAPDTSKGPLPD
jgi:MFS family permease